ncbi:hypothetical protein ACFP6A_00465 [Quadrisphaera sp. GCM10027208]|jgi:hypothetical protein|nr:hypothetical protein HJG43_02805 [Kineosporiaceae bacterium SCSIO 59966]
MSDKSHTQNRTAKKPGRSIKEKRAAKRAKHDGAQQHDAVTDLRKH